MASAPNQTTLNPQPLLATKLFAPILHNELVSRPRLVNRFQEGLERRLTVVSAPAGSGKTTLVAEWHASDAGSVVPLAWISLDDGDNDPARLLSYLVAAVRTIHPEIGNGIMAALRSGQSTATEYLMALLLNEISALKERFVLTLDDYHVIKNEAIHTSLTYLLDHLPAQLHLVITGRSEPPLPLARLRGRGQLAEFREDDLRFTTEEVATLFNRVLGLELDEAIVTALTQRTEGWAAGLVLAAISLNRQADPEEIILGFTGSNRYVFDYLADEVLAQQPSDLRSFLLETSILDQICAALCDAVTRSEVSQQLLERIEDANLFLVPLDDARRWYRYHHLFAEFLVERLERECPDRLPELHRRARSWYQERGFHAEAIEHALRGQDWEQAANLVGAHGISMVLYGQPRTVLRWMNTFPPEMFESQPLLGRARVWSLVLTGQINAAKQALDRLTAWIETQPETEIVPGFEGTLDLARSTIARFTWDISESRRNAERAIQRLEGIGIVQAYTAAHVHFAYTLAVSGELSRAREIIEAIMPAVLETDSPVVISDARLVQCYIAVSEGRFGDAERIAHKLERDEAGHTPVSLGAPSVVLARVLRERNRLDEAHEEAIRALAMADHSGLINNYLLSLLEIADIELARGDPEGALETIDDVDRLALETGMNAYGGHQSNAIRVQAALAIGDRNLARRSVRLEQIEIGEAVNVPRGREIIATARVLLADGEPQRAIQLLSALCDAAREKGVLGTLPEALVVLSRAYHDQNQIELALDRLAQSLAIAEPEGLIRIYIAEVEPAANLLQQLLRTENWETFAASRRISTGFVTTLLKEMSSAQDSSSGATQAAGQSLIEPLTERELEVLALLAEGKSNRDIAEELYLATGTIKTHSHNIYQKLDVRNRTQAIIRAKELALIE